MKKKIIISSLLGALIGVAISYIISLAVSLAMADGNYYPVVPQLAADCGSEMNAVLLQTVCSLLYGAVWGGMSLIWKSDRMSLLQITVIHFITCSAATFPIAYITRWMPHNLGGILTYFCIFAAIYFAIWLWQYNAIKKRIQSINKKMQENLSDI